MRVFYYNEIFNHFWRFAVLLIIAGSIIPSISTAESASGFTNYYERLGVNSDSTHREIRSAYIALRLKLMDKLALPNLSSQTRAAVELQLREAGEAFNEIKKLTPIQSNSSGSTPQTVTVDDIVEALRLSGQPDQQWSNPKLAKNTLAYFQNRPQLAIGYLMLKTEDSYPAIAIKVNPADKNSFISFLTNLRMDLIRVYTSSGNGRELYHDSLSVPLSALIYQQSYSQNLLSALETSFLAASVAVELKLDSELIIESMINAMFAFKELTDSVDYQMGNRNRLSFSDVGMYVYQNRQKLTSNLQLLLWELYTSTENRTQNLALEFLLYSKLNNTVARQGVFDILQAAGKPEISNDYFSEAKIAGFFMKNGTSFEKAIVIKFLQPTLTWTINPSVDYGRMPNIMKTAIATLVSIPNSRDLAFTTLTAYLRNEEIDYRDKVYLVEEVFTYDASQDHEVINEIRALERRLLADGKVKGYAIHRIAKLLGQVSNSCQIFLEASN